MRSVRDGSRVRGLNGLRRLGGESTPLAAELLVSLDLLESLAVLLPVSRSELDVVARRRGQKGHLLWSEVAEELGRVSGPDLPCRHAGVGGDNGPCCDHGVALNHSAIHDSGAHADERLVLDCCAVNRGAVPDRDV